MQKHLAQEVQTAAHTLDIAIVPLPSYRPDFLPVEHLWHWLREEEENSWFQLRQGSLNPISLANGVGDVGDDIFRVVLTIGAAARSLSEIAQAKPPMVAICSDSQAPQGQNMVGLILAVPWSAENKTSLEFTKTARQHWRGDVSWRTAGASDATYALAQGFGQNPSHRGLK